MATLTTEDILAAIEKRKREVEPFLVEEWDLTVYIRRLTAADLKTTGLLDASKDSDADAVLIKLVSVCLANEDGETLFTQEQLESLADAEFAVLMRIFSECASINGLEMAGLEEAMAAFGAAQAGGSSTS
jgi:hypothetical protein